MGLLMSKIKVEYGYFEAMQETMKDKSKVFIRIGFEEEDVMKISMLFNQKENNIDIIEDYLKTDVIEGGDKLKLRINDKWANSKWILVEEMKTYNIRVYNIDSGRLISSENKTTTEKEKNIYCESKIIWGTTVFKEFINEVIITRVVCEEIIIT